VVTVTGVVATTEVVVTVAVVVAVVIRVAVVVSDSVVVIPHPLATNTLAEISTAAMIMAEATTRELRDGALWSPLEAVTLGRRTRPPDFPTLRLAYRAMMRTGNSTKARETTSQNATSSYSASGYE
jgi:hypothetical protein